MKKSKTKTRSWFRKIAEYMGIVLGTVVLMVVVYYGEKTSEWFKATILEPPQPFNGTTYPVQKVPNWTRLLASRNISGFDSIANTNLIDIPSYDINMLQYPNDKLVWGKSEDEKIRNAKITYSVVYLGNYKLDHTENVGSHLAVDIKIPIGTPLYAIANGQVTKASLQESGFGHHIVIKHPDAADPDNPGQKTVLYSIYAHMSDVYVKEGQNVVKGQMIGRSGETGTATTPHLHFQIDRDSAPWHPYWPFTLDDERKAGLSFFDSINAGLGKDRAIQNTTNPMMYVQKYLQPVYLAADSDASVDDHASSNDNHSVVEPEKNIPKNPVVTPVEHTTEVSETSDNATAENTNLPQEDSTGLLEFKITGEHFGLMGSSVNLYVEDLHNELSNLKEGQTIPVRVQGEGRTNKKILQASDFKNKIATLSVNSNSLGQNIVSIGKSTFDVNFIETAKPVAKFKIESDEQFIPKIPFEITVRAVDSEDKPTPTYNFNGTLDVTAKSGEARFNPTILKASDFKEGIAHVTVTPLSEASLVIRIQNGALIGESDILKSSGDKLFSDVKASNPAFRAIKFLKENNIVGGYPDGTFRPTQTVTRAEAIKMLLTAFDVDLKNTKTPNFKDTNSNEWYAPFLGAAVQNDIVAGYADGTFRPAKTVNRAEYLKILFKTNDMAAGQPVVAPYPDVATDAWFAPYAYLANKKNILPESDNLNPTAGMTRADVAETIYRMKMIQINSWVSFNEN